MDLSLKDKVAIVTGAGRGIGRQIALTLAEEGAKVAVNDYYEDRAKAVADEIKAAGGQGIGVKADVTNLDEVQAMVKKVVDKWGTVHILCNNAGIAGIIEGGVEVVMQMPKEIMGRFIEMNKKGWDQSIQVN